MKTKYQILVVIGAVLFLLGGGLVLSLTRFNAPAAEASTARQAEAGSGRVITVVGEGKVSAAPDIALVNLGVQVSDREVKAATQKAADDMAAVLAALTGAGIADQDIETSYYSLYVERPYGPEGPSEEVLYQVSNTVQVTIRDLSKLTEILGLAIEAGANNINSITFDLSEPAELRAEARQKAVEDARATAEELAQLNGVTLGEVVSVSEIIPSGGYYMSELASASIGLGGGGGPISPGDVDVTTQLQVSYAIAQ